MCSRSPQLGWCRPALLALLLQLGACAALPEFDWNPLIRVEHTADGAVEVEALGPIIDIRNGPDGVSHALRPLYQHRANSGLPITDWLAPFGRSWDVHDGSRWRFWPLIWSGHRTVDERGTHWGTVVFPIIFVGGGTGREDGYLAVFPLAGRTRGMFGIDTFDFFLWPLFMRTHMDITEPSTSWTVLLIGGWTTGGPRDGSWRFLPFYRHRLVRDPEGEMRTDQQTAPWPFYTWGRDYMDSKHPSYRMGLWPLLSHERAESWSRTTWLWPFFRVNQELNPSTQDGGQFLYDLPWPLFRWARSEDISTLRLFPFYSRQISPDLDSTAYIIPLGWYRRSRGQTSELGHPPVPYQRTDSWFLPFWHRMERRVDERVGEDTEMQVWPLFHTDARVDGPQHSAFPSVIPARNMWFMEPVDELYGPFFTLWRNRSTPGASETRLLFDTTFWRSSPEGTRVSIPFLYSRRPLPAGGSRHGVLWGLFGARTDTEGLAALSLAGWELWTR